MASVLTSIWVILFQELKASEALSQPFPSFSLSVFFSQGKRNSNSSHVYVSDFFNVMVSFYFAKRAAS